MQTIRSDRKSGYRDVGMEAESGYRDVGMEAEIGYRNNVMEAEIGYRDGAMEAESGYRDVGMEAESGYRDNVMEAEVGSRDGAMEAEGEYQDDGMSGEDDFGTVDTIWHRFKGSRIVLSGVDGPEYQAFFQSLVAVSAASGVGFRVVDGVENAIDGDYVLLFSRTRTDVEEPEKNRSQKGLRREKKPEAGRQQGGKPDRAGQTREDWNVPFDEPVLHHTWVRRAGSEQAAEQSWYDTMRLLGELRELTTIRPEAVLLVSGNEVYGRCFGRPHPLKEEELGYISHTDSRDAAAQGMRVAEHMACSLAIQSGLNVRAARLGTLPERSGMAELLAWCMRVLLYGQAGEIYNLPEISPDDAAEDWKQEPEIADLYKDYPESGRQRRSIEERTANVSAEMPGEDEMQQDLTDDLDRIDNGAGKVVRFPGMGAAAGAVRKQAQLLEEEPSEAGAEAERPLSAASRVQHHVKKAPETVKYAAEGASPLTPLEIVTDTEKAEGLGR